jgi:hypothetical protein
VTKRYLIAAAARNLGRILRQLTGVGKQVATKAVGALLRLRNRCLGDTDKRQKAGKLENLTRTGHQSMWAMRRFSLVRLAA